VATHPTIWSFEDAANVFLTKPSMTLYSALATLPALESIRLATYSIKQPSPEVESALANQASLTQPSLRSVCFDPFDYTPALCQATANTLEGSAITKLEFINCSFSAGECAVMVATGLSRNTSVTRIKVEAQVD
jgi:hypothetical protein